MSSKSPAIGSNAVKSWMFAQRAGLPLMSRKLMAGSCLRA